MHSLIDYTCMCQYMGTKDIFECFQKADLHQKASLYSNGQEKLYCNN